VSGFHTAGTRGSVRAACVSAAAAVRLTLPVAAPTATRDDQSVRQGIRRAADVRRATAATTGVGREACAGITTAIPPAAVGSYTHSPNVHLQDFSRRYSERPDDGTSDTARC
jgi:hypothetical protein